MRKLNKASLSGIQLISLILVFLFFLISPYQTYSNYKGKDKDKNKIRRVLGKTQGDDPVTTLLNINNITTFIQPDGFHPWEYAGGWCTAFPKGTAGGIFAEGIVWGGLVNDGQSPVLRVGGNTYISGTVPLTPSHDGGKRIYRVRPDYKTADLTDDAANFFHFQNFPLDAGLVSEGEILILRDQYGKDWLEWPVDLGAPYDDVDSNGVYDPNVDIPGISGASQTIWIYYNDAIAPNIYGSPPIGLEVQETYWAYSIANPLGDAIFKKVNIVYKGTENTPPNAEIVDMYITQWSDPDIGQFTDDFAGVDTLLNLGYAYSSRTTDAVYLGLGLAPPALGYDFLQGVSQFTGNPNDSAIFNLKWRRGYKYVHPPDKPMTTFVYFAAGGAWGDPDLRDPLGTPQWYNLMRGFLPRPPYPQGLPFPANVGGTLAGGVGTYLLSGDPVTGTGLVDGVAEGPGDRRIACVHGPFNMALNDTAEVVIALLGGIGSNNLTSISVLKFTDRFVQFAYDNLFDLPVFPSPSATLTNFDGNVLLNWGTDPDAYNELENASPNGYDFQGYNVYQLPTPSSSLSDAVKIATFDLIDEITVILDDQLDIDTGEILKVPVQVGKNSGIIRFMEVTTDAVRNEPLRNGSEHYFAVTAYGYNPDETLPFNALESSPVVITAVPQSTTPGVRYNSSVGDTIEVIHIGGSDGAVYPIVVDPSAVTGNSYKVTFQESDAGLTWTLTDVTTGTDLLSDQTNESGDDTYAIIDGIMIKVLGPPAGMKGWEIPEGTRRFTWAGADGFGWEGFNGAIGWGSPFAVFGGGTEPVAASELFDVLLKLASVPEDPPINYEPTFDPGDVNMSYGYRYGRAFASPMTRPEFDQYYVNTSATGYEYQAFEKNVPLSAWDVSDPANPRRLAVGFLENNQEGDLALPVNEAGGGLVDGKWWPGSHTLFDNVAGGGPREWLWIFNTDYSETPNPEFQVEPIANPVPVMWWLTVNRRGNPPFSPGVSGEDQFLILSNKVNTNDDSFTFSAPTVSQSIDDALVDIKKINVFPNPYYGFHSREVTRDGKFVTFSHLPPKATIRIFDLAGVLVKTIEKNDASQFIRWNLQNDNNFPIASGIYVVYIDLPDLGTSKILKFAVVQEEQILRVY